jgi:putative membrane protein
MAAARLRLVLGLLVMAWLFPTAAGAHGETGHGMQPLATWIAQACVLLAWMMYAIGAWRRPPTGGLRILFHGTMALAVITLFGPLDAWAYASTAWHMMQHMLIMVVVAPLWVLAQPLPQWRAATGRRFDALWRLPVRASRYPMACAALHALAIWGWHAPVPYMLAVQNPAWHVLEHASFLLTAVLFWWSVLRAGRTKTLEAMLALLLTLSHTGMLGALLTFARAPLYHAESTQLWDQQLAGLVMWIPGSLVYLLAIGWVARHWFHPTHHAPTRATHL